ncbi:hypothetical protein ABZ806_21665 [Spirillospora sp. NPDC047418]|jgi:hypothetical protein
MRPAAAIMATLLLAAGLSGCSMLDDRSSESGSAASPDRASYDDAAKPVVKGTFDSPAAKGATVDISIMRLKAKGKLATLTVQITPHLPATDTRRINAYGLNGEHRLGTSLIDPVNLKRYLVVEDSDRTKMETDDIFTKMTNDQATPFSFTFAAPPENVKSLDVQIGSWPMFRDIPVER